MSADLYKVSWNDQGDAASSVNTAVSGIQDKLDTINSDTEKLCAEWGDDAQSKGEYRARQTAWNTAANEMVSSLMEFKSSLDKSAGISQGTEMDAARIVSS